MSNFGGKLMVAALLGGYVTALVYMGGTMDHSSAHASPQPYQPHPVITHISPDDPAVKSFQKFADEKKLAWRIHPDVLDGRLYCALLGKRGDRLWEVAACDDSIGLAAVRAIAKYNAGARPEVGVGSK